MSRDALGQWLDECRDLLRQQRIEDAAKSINYQTRVLIKSLGIFLVIPLMGTVMVGYFVVREIQLNSDKKLIRECEGKEYCDGRIEALERLVKANLSLKSYNLESSDLVRANLRFADLVRTNLESADLVRTNLSSANLYGADLQSANLYGANLQSANLYGTDLQSANLYVANLYGANLQSANLQSADLYGTDLQSANLYGANLQSASLRATTIDQNTKLDPKWRKVWEIVNQGAEAQDLYGANLESANLYGADLVRANLSSARLWGADLRDASLWGADLSSANLIRANLSSADLSSANLSSADLQSANLIEAKNLTPSQIKSACYWEKAFYKGSWDNENYKWIVDKKANTEYIEELKQDKNSAPERPVDCSKWESS